MLYNLTSLGNATGFLGFTQGVSSLLMEDMLGILFLVVIYVIALISFMTANPDNPKPAFIGASFIGFIVCLGLWIVSLVPVLALYVSIILLAGSVAMGSK